MNSAAIKEYFWIFLLKESRFIKLFLTICGYFFETHWTSILRFSTAINQTQIFSKVKARVTPAGFGKKLNVVATEETVCCF